MCEICESIREALRRLTYCEFLLAELKAELLKQKTGRKLE